MELTEILDGLSAIPIMRNTAGTIPTGSLGLDLALGGGLATGKIVELAGEPSSFKSMLALVMAAQAQKLGPVLWLDSASDFSPIRAHMAGVDPGKIVVTYPRDTHHAMDIMRAAARDCSLMVLDSASGMDQDLAHEDLERWMSWLKSDLQPAGTALITSQLSLRSDDYFCQAVRAWSGQRVQLHPDGGQGKIRAVVTKNSACPPWRDIPIHLRFADGVLLPTYELVFLGLECGVLQRRGSWIAADGLMIGAGTDAAYAALCNQPVLADQIRTEIAWNLA